MISTDHAPHTLTEKQDLTNIKYGVPGLETTLPLMLTAVKNKLIKFERVIDMLSTNPRKIFSLPNQEDSYVLLDLKKEQILGEKELFTKCGWTPFKHFKTIGSVHAVYLNNKKVYEDGHFLGSPIGKIIHPRQT